MTIEERLIQAGDVGTHARVAGEGGTALVLLHGAEADGAMWGPYMADLARGRRVYGLDLPGHGGTEAPQDVDCSPRGLARWLSAFLEAEGLERCDLLGHSLGGAVAVRIAILEPGLVRRLVVVDGTNLFEPSRAFGEGANELLAAVVEGGLEEGTARELLARTYAKDPSDPDIVEGARSWVRPGVRTFFSRGGIEVVQPLSPLRLRELSVPTLLVWGSRDRFFTVEGAREAALFIPSSRLVVLEGAGHSPFVDAPDVFQLAVDAFLLED